VRKKALELVRSEDGNALSAFASYVHEVMAEYYTLRNDTKPSAIVEDLRLEHDTKRALWCGCDIDLTVTEFRVLSRLVEGAGGFVSYRSIYDVMHYTGFVAGNGDEGYRANVRSIIKRVRRKFMKVEVTFDRIENYPSLGYRWRITHGC
jgi:DNA-binding response OmpR family regulator